MTTRKLSGLLNNLRLADHQVWLDEWDIGFGDSIVGRMNEGLEGPLKL